MLRLFFAFALVLFMHAPAFAEEPVPAIEIISPYAFETAPMAQNGAVFLDIKNNGADNDALASVTAPTGLAETIELHEMKMDIDGIMQMTAVETLDLPAGETLSLTPHGYHIMLIGLEKPLEQGAPIDLILTFEKAGNIKISVPVRAAGDTPEDAG